MWHKIDTALIKVTVVLNALNILHRMGATREFLSELDLHFAAMDKSIEEIKKLISDFDGV